ncbi:MAG: phosphoenolpyruvate carboxylase [Chlamydiales bacterium]
MGTVLSNVSAGTKREREFHQRVVCDYERFNSLFLALPFERVRDTGDKLPYFATHLKQCIEDGVNSKLAVDSFFRNVLKVSRSEDLHYLFSFVQYIERQVLLFDALEDASFTHFMDMKGEGTLHHLLSRLENEGKQDLLLKHIDDTSIRVVLTAHPTQFYPIAVLGILRDLTQAIADNDLEMVNDLLLQLGKTPFQRVRSPTPLDEANSLIWILKEVIYKVIPPIRKKIKSVLGSGFTQPLVEMGFWPGGDRDGNPFVTADVTAAVLLNLRRAILELYLKELELLSQRLTFHNISDQLEGIYQRLKLTMKDSSGEGVYENSDSLLQDLFSLREAIVTQHLGLFVGKLDDFITIVESFGFHFAHLDVRQNASVHRDLLGSFGINTEEDLIPLFEKKNLLSHTEGMDPVFEETLKSFRVIRDYQALFGEKAIHRYIISNTQSYLDVLNVLGCSHLSGWNWDEMTIDIVPLFESTEDLKNSQSIMRELYKHPIYREHLRRRGNCQTVMLGFSDGTKDGGYLKANWGIFECRHALSKLSEELGVKITFFDGRGGPPARGGGDTHKFYRAMEKIPSDIHLTIQGQTITTKFATEESASFNIEQLLSAGLHPKLFRDDLEEDMSKADEEMLMELSELSRDSYHDLKNDPLFVPYLQEISPLPYFGELNIASRPVSRTQNEEFSFESLRAIPFVGSWSQIKQNVPGYYGLGTAFSHAFENGKSEQLKNLYKKSLFFRTLLNNCRQSLSKTKFSLTQHLAKDARFKDFWMKLKNEAQICRKALEEISGEEEISDHDRIVRKSVELRESLILPLTVIQQYGLIQVREGSEDSETYKKLIRRSVAAILNAARNSA